MSGSDPGRSRITIARMVSFGVLLGVIAIIGFLFYRVVAGFLLPLFLAAMLVVLFHPVYRWMVARWRWRRGLAALATTLLVGLVVMVPLCVTLVVALLEGRQIVEQFNPARIEFQLARLRQRFPVLRLPLAETWREAEKNLESLWLKAQRGRLPDPGALEQLQGQLGDLEEYFGGSEPSLREAFNRIRGQIAQIRQQMQGEEEISAAETEVQLEAVRRQFHLLKQQALGGSIPATLKELANPTSEQIAQGIDQLMGQLRQQAFLLGGRTTAWAGRFVLGLIIMLVAFYFFLVDGPAMIQTVMRLSPLDDAYERELLAEFDRVSRAVVLASLLSAVVQAILAGLGFWMAGVPSVFLLALLTALFAMIPFVGAAAVWLPTAAWLYFVQESTWGAIFLAIYGTVVISTSDNIIKPMVLHGQSKLHPLLALLSVLGGVQALGPIGVVVGPMVVAFLQTLLNILHRELTALQQRLGDNGAA